ncbi:MAG: hypothetical protein H6563_08360 [Lewinellaceae bacterium]|nr:hypothetical protein [Lewinellaceae bacterium]
MKKPILTLFLPLALCFPARAQLSKLSDNFDNPRLFSASWMDINQVEGWGISQLEECRIDTLGSGRLVLKPYSCTWDLDKKGPFRFKTVEGDFIFTTEVNVSNRAGNGLPKSEFSMAGVMIRAPKYMPGPAWWEAGQENYVYLTAGFATSRHPSCMGCKGPHLEAKSTVNSGSTYSIFPLGSSTVTLRIARMGKYVYLLYKEPDGRFSLVEKFLRPDLPNTLQVGLICYTDWQSTKPFTDDFHNRHNLTAQSSNDPQASFSPDLLARFDYAYFAEVTTTENPLYASNEQLMGIPATAPTQYISVWTPADGPQVEVRAIRRAEFLDTLAFFNARSYELTDLSIYFRDGKWRYDGVWQPGVTPVLFYQTENWYGFRIWALKMARKGYQLADFEMFGDSEEQYYAGVWNIEKEKRVLYGAKTWKTFYKKWERLAGSGYTLIDIEAYPDGSSGWIAGLWERGSGPSRLVWKDDWETFANQWKDYESQGIHLTDVETFQRNGKRWYIGIGRQDAPSSQLGFHPSWDDLRMKTGEMKALGLQLEDLERVE